MMMVGKKEIRGAAESAFRCHDEEILVDGPAGTGKTTALLLKALTVALKYPHCRVLLTRKTRASMSESVLVTFEEHVLGINSPIVGKIQRKNRTSYKIPGGGRIVVSGLDNVERIKSSEYDLILVFEATECNENDIEVLITRLRNDAMPYQQLISDCNPDNPTHWLITRANNGKCTRFPSRHEDNPAYYDREGRLTDRGKAYMSKLDRLTGYRYKRLRKGEWVSSDGCVFDFDPRVHVVPRFRIPESWQRIRVIDFGYEHAFVCQWWAIDGDGRLYRYREIHMRRRTVEEHVKGYMGGKGIVSYSMGESYLATVSDHDSGDRATLHRHGISTAAATKRTMENRGLLRDRLKLAGDGRPRVFYLEDSLVEVDVDARDEGLPTKTEDEFYGYKVKPGTEEAVKANDDGMDATMYAVSYVDRMLNGSSALANKARYA